MRDNHILPSEIHFLDRRRFLTHATLVGVATVASPAAAAADGLRGLTLAHTRTAGGFAPLEHDEIAVAQVSAASDTGVCINVRDFGAKGDGATDDTAAIQASLDASLCVRFGDASLSYKISGTLHLRTGHQLEGCGSTITQTAIRTPIFLASTLTDISISGFHGVGVGTDYNDSDSSQACFVYQAKSCARIRIFNNRFTGFSYTPVRFGGAVDCQIMNNIIVGPGTPTLTPIVSGKCYGVLFDTGCVGCLVSGNSISHTANGIRIEGSREVRIVGNDIFSIDGQHGIYIGSAITNITIIGNSVHSTRLIGIKVQAAEAAAVDNVNVVVSNNVVDITGGQGILLANSSSPATYKNRGATVTGNTVRGTTGAGLSFNNCVGVTVSGNTVESAGDSGINISEVQGFVIDGNIVRDTVNCGIRDQIACTHITISNNRIENCATATTAGNRFGILVQDATEYIIAGNIITDANARMELGLYVVGGTLTGTVVRHNIVRNATSFGARFPVGNTVLLDWTGNNFQGTNGSIAHPPVLPTVASQTSIALPLGGAAVFVSGTTNITRIAGDGQVGHTVTLIFLGVLTIHSGGNLLFSADFTTRAHDALTLICDGHYWYELSRSVNA